MPGRLARLTDFMHRPMLPFTAGSLRLRGVQIPVEPFLKGKPRFARLSGAYLAVISPDNTMTLVARAAQNTALLMVDRVLSRWLAPGCKLLLEGREVVTVEDFSDETNAISLTANLEEDHDANAEVLLYATPITINGNESAGATVIVVKTPYDVAVGDQLVVDLVEYDVTVASLVNFDTITLENTWEVTLSKGLHRDLEDQGTIYLRCWPAYVRVRAPVPSIPALAGLTAGPFVLDRVSGTLVGEESYDEFLTVTPLGPNFQPIDDPEPAGKNHPLLRLTIPADAMLFWDRAEGDINWDGNNTVGFLTDPVEGGEGRFRVVTRLEPALPVGQITEWRLPIRPLAPPGAPPTRVGITVEPGGMQAFTLPNNVITTVSVAFPPAPATRIRVAAIGQFGVRVEFGPWTVVGSQVRAVSFTLVARASGVYRWASSGLFVKPYFYNLDYVRARLDTGTALDSGFLILD